MTPLLRPQVQLADSPVPTRIALKPRHHAAHESCCTTNPVKTEVRCEPV